MISTTTLLDAVLHELEDLPWCVWKYVPRKDNPDKLAKVPYHPYTEKPAKPNDTSTWGTYQDANWLFEQLEGYSDGFDGIGFLLTEDDPFTVVDLDGCINLDTGEITDEASELVQSLDSYTEFSPSGTGLHIIVRGAVGNKKRNSVEVYSRDRYMTFTGNPFPGYDKPIRDTQNALDDLVKVIAPEKSSRPAQRHIEAVEVALVDRELLDKARQNERFRKLYDDGVWSGKKSHSEADMELCGMLAYWTGCDAGRMDALFRASALIRKKWDQKIKDSTYGRRTIELAIQNCTNTYNPNYKGRAKQGVQDVLDECEQLSLTYQFRGRARFTDRAIYLGLISLSREFGKLDADGVVISCSVRQLSDVSGLGKDTAHKGLTRLLGESELVEAVDDGDGNKKQKYRIKRVPPKLGQHIHNPTVLIAVPLLGKTLRVRYAYWRITWEQRIGKGNGWVLDLVHASGENGLTKQYISSVVGIREDHLKTRNLDMLVERGFLIEQAGRYFTPEDIEDRLERHLEDSGSNAAAANQKARHERDRASWKLRNNLITGEEYSRIVDTNSGDDQPHCVNHETNLYERDYVNPEDFCLHWYYKGSGCYLCDKSHPYRQKEMEIAA